MSQHRTFLPMVGQAGCGSQTPPFWELERLIEQGLARPLALDVLAARRMAGRGITLPAEAAWTAWRVGVAATHRRYH